MRIPARFTATAVGLSLALLPALPSLNPTALSAVGLAPARAEVQKPVLRIGAIPDQNPEKLNRLQTKRAEDLSALLFDYRFERYGLKALPYLWARS